VAFPNRDPPQQGGVGGGGRTRRHAVSAFADARSARARGWGLLSSAVHVPRAWLRTRFLSSARPERKHLSFQAKWVDLSGHLQTSEIVVDFVIPIHRIRIIWDSLPGTQGANLVGEDLRARASAHTHVHARTRAYRRPASSRPAVHTSRERVQKGRARSLMYF
jgi:hypothetical protein